MYNKKDIVFVGKHDYNKVIAEKYASYNVKTFSVNIFKWVLKASGKEMKPGKCVVRVHGSPGSIDAVLKTAESIVYALDNNQWDGRKNVFVK